ncbi:MAG: sensor histidine kinase, partial [Limisphaerales bacterium]
IGLEQQHAIEKERTRIAQDMHDQLGANLTEIGLLTELTKRTSSRPHEINSHLGKISERAREVSQTLDEIIWAVNPKNDSLPRLAAYIVHYAEELCEIALIQCRWHVSKNLPDIPLSAEVRHNIFLAVREALNNIVRHSAASEARLQLSAENSTLEIVLEDNGRGFSVEDLDPSGNGLDNIKKRIETLGGRIEMISSPNHGTKIGIIVKLKN